MINPKETQRQLVKSTSGPDVDKLVWNHLYHSIKIQLVEAQSKYSNNQANAYMLKRELAAVDKYYKDKYGEYPESGEKVGYTPNSLEKERANRQEYLRHRANNETINSYNRSGYYPKRSKAKRQRTTALINGFIKNTSWKQKDLAKFLGVHQATVSAWKTGRASIPMKHEKKLTEALRIKSPEFKEFTDRANRKAANYLD